VVITEAMKEILDKEATYHMLWLGQLA